MSSLVIYNAKIYVEKGHFEESLLAVDGVIRAMGSNEEILSQAPADARRYDAAGRTVVPGFNDSHQHMQSVGEILSNIQLLGADSIGEVKRRVREFIEKNHPAPGTVLHGMGWNQDYFKDEHRLLLKADLDEMAPDYPLILERACGHILTANSPALALAGITGSTVPVEGGAIDLDEQGEPTGVIRENACSQVLRIIPPATEETLDAQLRLAMAHAAECGVTSVQSMDMRPGKWRETWAAYRRVQAKDPTVRVYQQVNFMEPVEFRKFLSEGFHTGMGDPFLKIGPLKMFADGSLGARTALMRSPYHDDPSTQGMATLTQETLDEMVGIATEHDCSCVVHAIGDGAIHMVLSSYEKILKDGKNPLRHGIVHCQITDRPMLERFRANDILALVQPIFLHYDMTVVEDRVGKELASTSYAFETLRRLGVHESFGTDSPVEDMNAINNLYCAVTRKNLSGEPAGGFYPEECMDIYDAVDAYTYESAYVSFEEGVKGRLKPGYYADMVVLSQDIFTIPADEIIHTKVDATIVDGRFVYER